MDKTREVEIKKLTDLVNDVKTAVDNSAFGPMFQYPDPTNPIQKDVNQLAWSLYLHLISPMMKDYADRMFTNPKSQDSPAAE